MQTALMGEMDVEWLLEKISGKPRRAPPPLPTIKTPEQLEQRKKDQSDRKMSEVDLWHAWDKGGRKMGTDLDPLLKSFQPMIQGRVNVYKNRVEYPTSVIEHEHKMYFVQALKTWDPSKGTLQTWVGLNLKRAGRDVDTNKNFARIPENVYKNIGSFNALKSELTEKLGHEPDDQTIHDHILETGHERLGRLSLKEIRRLNRDQRKGLIAKGHETDPGQYDPREEEIIHTIHYQLTPQERLVHEYSFGINGKPKLSSGDIAKTLKMDPSKVSKIRTIIRKKIQSHLES